MLIMSYQDQIVTGVPEGVRQPEKTCLQSSGEFLQYVNNILKLMGRPTVSTGQQLKATVWDLGITVISITELLILFLDNLMYKCIPW
jgi:hypothetical protein